MKDEHISISDRDSDGNLHDSDEESAMHISSVADNMVDRQLKAMHVKPVSSGLNNMILNFAQELNNVSQ